jgi:endoglucanase
MSRRRRGRAALQAALACLVLGAGVAAAGSRARPGAVTAPVSGRRQQADAPAVFVRVNQLGYRPGQIKTAIVFADHPFDTAFTVVRVQDGTAALAGRGSAIAASWPGFSHHALADFTALRTPGTYRLRVAGSDSLPFSVSDAVYAPVPDVLLEFMRQQRCGYNPFLDAVCHPFDGRTAFGPMPDASYVDARGGWHDAGDSLKYLLTSSNAVAQLLLAWRLAPSAFGDRVNDLGQPRPNGQADVLDEARWGLEWMLRLHPAPDQLFHQVADDRDHSGWRLPQNDASDYGWGKGSYRVVYFATGRPQGLRQFQSESTGIANLAGRYAAAMAMAYDVFKGKAATRDFADRCLRAGKEVYAMGRRQEGVQQGNSYGAPYRYIENSWADDMEWGAAELYRVTRDSAYLAEATRYAATIGATSWMGRESAGHYEFYPFMNLGHVALFGLAGPATRRQLARYYEDGLGKAAAQSELNAYRIGVPFIWCSNNLVVALATQGILYERMTGVPRFAALAAAARDWLLGRNPWGTSMFTGLPETGTFPHDPHLILPDLTGRPVRGGLVDGPVAESIFKSLKGVALSRPDPFAPFQSARAVYHDDMQDYSSNEPTMDGTASAVLLMALLAGT